MEKTQLNQFDPKKNLNRGRSKLTEMLWYLFKRIFFLSSLPWPSKLKLFILQVFGAKVGKGVNIKPRVNIHMPWKLEIGDHCWIGEEVFILNFEKVLIGANSCLSQRAFLCTGNHNFRAIDFEYLNKPITIGEGCWIGAQVFVGPNVHIGNEAVLTAGSIVTKDIPENKICSGNPCREIKDRWQ